MSAIIARLKNEPAVVVSVVGAVLLAGAQTLAGHQVIGADIPDTIARAFDPDGGWAYVVLLGIITRAFVYGPGTVAAIRGDAE